MLGYHSQIVPILTAQSKASTLSHHLQTHFYPLFFLKSKFGSFLNSIRLFSVNAAFFSPPNMHVQFPSFISVLLSFFPSLNVPRDLDLLYPYFKIRALLLPSNFHCFIFPMYKSVQYFYFSTSKYCFREFYCSNSYLTLFHNPKTWNALSTQYLFIFTGVVQK